MAHLVVLFGPKRGVRLELADTVIVGRAAEATLQLVDAKVSREHCRFDRADGGRVTVEDLGSHNGTYVNGVRVDGRRELAPGDEVAIGDSLLVYDLDLDVAAARFGDATVLLTDGGGESAAGAGARTVAAQAPAAAAAAAVTPAEAATAAVATVPAAVLSRLAARLLEADDAEAAAQTLLAAIVEELAPDRAFVLARDAAGGVRPLVGRSQGATVSVSRTALALAERSGRPVVVENAAGDRQLRDARSVMQHRLESVLVAPVRVRDGVVAFLHCDRLRPPYREADAAVLEAIAAVAAVHGLCVGVRDPAAAAGTTPPVGARGPGRAAGGASSAPGPVGTSPTFSAALRVARAAAAAPSTVLLTGETGTGKEELARFIHAESPRARGPFVVVNAGAIPETLAESQLFGHERGAFTGAVGTQLGLVEAADGGTLFLDEVGELPLPMQVKLLRVLQERAVVRVGAPVARRVDFRLVAATNRDLEGEVKAGRFREDLFYRLNVIRIHLPPLRERQGDVGPLAAALLVRLSAGLGRTDPGLAPGGAAALEAEAWPGNVRELANVLERALVLRPPGVGGPIGRDEIATALGPRSRSAVELPEGGKGTLADKIVALERDEITAALRAARGVKARAAEALGISRPTLDKKIADLEIDLWRDGPPA